MSLTFPTATRNALATAFAALVDAGSGAGKVKILTSGDVLLVSFTLDTTAFTGPSTGVLTGANLPKSGTAVATGTAAKMTITDDADTIVTSGTCTATGGGGDATIDNTSIVSGQTCNLTSLTYTQPAS